MSAPSPDLAGIGLETAHRLVAVYTRPGDRVVDLDASTDLAQAARWWGCRYATALDSNDPQTPPGFAVVTPGRERARLVVVTLPAPGRPVVLAPLARLFRTWRAGLAPDGYVVARVLTHTGQQRFVHPASTVITAARTAGLLYHQHLIEVTRPLPEDEPRAHPSGTTLAPALRDDGRHHPAHRDLFVFATPGGCADA